jgi:hypothetical protein
VKKIISKRCAIVGEVFWLGRDGGACGDSAASDFKVYASQGIRLVFESAYL